MYDQLIEHSMGHRPNSPALNWTDHALNVSL